MIHVIIARNIMILDLSSMKIIVIKKGFSSVVSLIILEIIILNSVYSMLRHFDFSFFLILTGASGFLFVLFIIIKSIFFPYIIIDNQTIYIKHLFSKEAFSTDDIVGININDGLFSKSSFVLRNKKLVKFDSFFLKKTDLDLLNKIQC
jgi:hypothetical protein